MSPDTMTGGDWTLWAASTAVCIALIAWLVASGRREHRGQQALTRALHDCDQDIDDLMDAPPVSGFEAAFREWQARQ